MGLSLQDAGTSPDHAFNMNGAPFTSGAKRRATRLPGVTVRERTPFRLAILAWQGEPMATLVCAPDEPLRLHEVEMATWQAITLPRNWDDPDREKDAHVQPQIAKIIARVKASLYASMAVLDPLIAGWTPKK